MQTRTLIGRLLNQDGIPYEGMIEFLPKNLWVVEKGIYVASLAPRVELYEGKFEAEVSVGRYIVLTPVGRWKIHVKASPNRIGFLSDHMPQRYK